MHHSQFGFNLKSLLAEPQAPCTYYICVVWLHVYVYMHKLVCMCACMTCESGLKSGL